MQHFGVWGLTAGGFRPLRKSNLDFAPNLSRWLAETPALLAPDLTIVGRRLAWGTETIDLLALDGDGRWNIIAIAPGLIERERLVAALQQAAYLHKMAFDDLAALVNGYLCQQESGPRSLARLLAERDLPMESDAQRRKIQICLVGSSLAPDTADLIAYLHGRYQLPLHTALFAIYEDDGAQRFLVREPDPAAPSFSFVPPSSLPDRHDPRHREDRADEGRFIIFPPSDEPERNSPPPAADPARNPPAERPSPQPRTLADSSSGFHDLVGWAREQSGQVWQRAKTAVGRSAPDFAYTADEQRRIEELLDLAGRYGLADMLRSLLTMAERQKLHLTFGEGWVQLSRPDLDARPLLTARARARAERPGQLPLHLHYDVLAAAFACSAQDLFVRFGRNELRWLTAGEAPAFVKLFADFIQRKK